MIVEWSPSSHLRDVIIGTADRLKAIDARYLEIIRIPNVSPRLIKNNRSERFWILKDDVDCRAELERRGEKDTIPYWVKKSS